MAKIRRVTSHLEDVVSEDAIQYGATVRQPSLVVTMLEPMIGQRDRETFVALGLNAKHQVNAYYEVSVGTMTASLVHPREVFGWALRVGCAAIVVAHNHPSGDPTPSVEDIDVTKRLHAAGVLLGVPLLDHLILGRHDHWVSMRDREDWPS